MYKYIWWAPRCWKTTLSKKIWLENNFEIIHLDNFRTEIFKKSSEKEQKEFFEIIYFMKNFSKIHKRGLDFFRKLWFDIEILKKLWLKDSLENYIYKNWLEKYFEEEFKNSEFITKKFFENNLENKILEWVSVSPRIISEKIENWEIKKEETIFLIKSCKYDIENILHQNPWSFANRNIKNMVNLILKYSEKIEKETSNLWLKILDTSKTKIF